LVGALDKLRDSYNVNGLGQIAALATLEALPYYRANFERIKASRGRLSEKLSDLGFQVLPSQTNFILVRPPLHSAKVWLEKLRERKLLVRWFSAPEVKDFLRITIGTEAECAALLQAVLRILSA
jgi:histidinol-phosphate aminotransferase